MKCVICKRPGEMHHLKTRKSGGSDDDFNLLCVCRLHHQEFHRIGTYKMCLKYYHLKGILKQKGWDIVNEFGVMKLRRANDWQVDES